MKPFTPEELAHLLKIYAQNPEYQATPRDVFKKAAEALEEQSEIKPHLEAEIARLQKERDEAVEAGKKDKARIDWFEGSEPPFVICGNNKFFTVKGWSSAGEGKNLRVAIDAAMEAEK